MVSLSGNLYLRAGRAAFPEADAQLARLEGGVDHVLVDMHAEATSEKVGMGWYLDGRVTAVVGTHTHVPTADGRVLPGGTAYITDVGMTGGRGGVIGVKREQAVEALVTQLPVKFETSDRGPVADGRADHRVAAHAGRCDRADPASRASVSASANNSTALRVATSRTVGVRSATSSV